jgi:hypothetical protein
MSARLPMAALIAMLYLLFLVAQPSFALKTYWRTSPP